MQVQGTAGTRTTTTAAATNDRRNSARRLGAHSHSEPKIQRERQPERSNQTPTSQRKQSGRRQQVRAAAPLDLGHEPDEATATSSFVGKPEPRTRDNDQGWQDRMIAQASLGRASEVDGNKGADGDQDAGGDVAMELDSQDVAAQVSDHDPSLQRPSSYDFSCLFVFLFFLFCRESPRPRLQNAVYPTQNVYPSPSFSHYLFLSFCTSPETLPNPETIFFFHLHSGG